MSYMLASFLFSRSYSRDVPSSLPRPTQAFLPLLVLFFVFAVSSQMASRSFRLSQPRAAPSLIFPPSTHLPISLCARNSSSCLRPLTDSFLAVSISLASFCTEVHSNYSALKRDRSRGWGERRRRMKELSKGECSAVRRGKWRQVAGWIAAD